MIKETNDFDDSLIPEVIKMFIDENMASATLIQRKFCIGYPRAARIIDIMEDRGYISAPDKDYKRKLLITQDEYLSIFGEKNE